MIFYKNETEKIELVFRPALVVLVLGGGGAAVVVGLVFETEVGLSTLAGDFFTAFLAASGDLVLAGEVERVFLAGSAFLVPDFLISLLAATLLTAFFTSAFAAAFFPVYTLMLLPIHLIFLP